MGSIIKYSKNIDRLQTKFLICGELQSIHHIEHYEVFTDPSLHFREIPKDTWKHHYLYHLGPVMKPPHQVKSGKKILRNMRVWASLDLLLTCSTIEEARDKTRERTNGN